MESSSEHQREVRAARNESLFRSVNERLIELNATFASITDTFTIACECADAECVTMLDVEPAAYSAIRAEPHHFIVLADHVVPDIEFIVSETKNYLVVEKIGVAAHVAKALDEDSPTQPTSAA